MRRSPGMTAEKGLSPALLETLKSTAIVTTPEINVSRTKVTGYHYETCTAKRKGHYAS